MGVAAPPSAHPLANWLTDTPSFLSFAATADLLEVDASPESLSKSLVLANVAAASAPLSVYSNQHTSVNCTSCTLSAHTLTSTFMLL